MAEFGWAYLSGAVKGKGPTDSIQFLESTDGELSGSKDFTFEPDSSTLYLTGTMYISGTLKAHTFDAIHTTRVEISSSGNSSFGNSAEDLHDFTGSVRIKQTGTNDILNLYDNTSEVFTVLDGGNVGIGVSDPDTVLEIMSSGNQLKLSRNGTQYATFAVNSGGDLTVTPSGGDLHLTASNSIDLNSNRIDIGSDTANDTTINLLGTNDMAIVYDTSATLLNFDSDTMVVDGANNRVGIGVTDPDSKLEISSSTGAQLKLSHGIGNTQFTLDSSMDLTILNSGNDLKLSSSGGGSIYLQSKELFIGPNSTADIDIRLLGGTNDLPILYDESAKTLAFDTDQNTFIIDAGNQRIGIGVTDPDTTLEVLSTTAQLKLSYDGSNYSTFAVSSGGDLTITPSGGDVTITGSTSIDLNSKQIDFGANNTDDIVMNFLGSTNDGVLTWDESGDIFVFSDDVLMNSTEKLYFTDIGNEYIYGVSDGNLGIYAQASIDLRSPQVDIGNDDGSDVTINLLGSSNDMAIVYDESAKTLAFDTSDLFIDAANARVGIATAVPNYTLAVTGTLGVSGAVNLPGIPSGSLAGTGSYVGLSATGALVLTSSSGGATINNAVENRIVTVASTTSELDAESGLTFSSNLLTVTGDIKPEADNTRNLGAADKRWANIYTGDLHLKNDRGDWTILEEEDYLCVVNNKTGKRYKMMLQEIDD